MIEKILSEILDINHQHIAGLDLFNNKKMRSAKEIMKDYGLEV